MRNDLLSIGEVAHLKGVGVKALRYYERIGVLRPAYVNPDTGYRYYALRQMNELDVIVSCVQLGVPLKELADYVSDCGAMDISSLLERAYILAKEKLRDTQAILLELDGYRREIAVQHALRTSPAPRTSVCWESARFWRCPGATLRSMRSAIRGLCPSCTAKRSAHLWRRCSCRA